MKGRYWFTAAIALLVVRASAVDIASSGDWTQTITATDLAGGAGTDLNSQYDSPVGIATINISNVSGTWHVNVRRDTGTWPAGLHLWVRRTELEAGVRIERLTLDFVRVLKPYTQQLTDYSSTIRLYSITAYSLHLY